MYAPRVTRAPLAFDEAAALIPPDAGDLARLAAHFAQRHWARLPGLLAGQALARAHAALAEGRFQPKDHGPVGRELCLAPCALTEALTAQFNQRALFEAIDAITGCGGIGCFEGRVYRLVPGTDHRDAWHHDRIASRLVALSLNLSERPYEGGTLLLRDARSEAVLDEVENIGPGDAIVFRLGHDLEHRIGDMRGREPKTAWAGWFRMRPDYRDVVAGKANW